MPSIRPQDRVSLCHFSFADGRRCITPISPGHPHFCFFHAQKEAQSVAAEKLGRDLDYFFSGDYLSACDLSAALARLFAAVARGHIKPRAARTLAYLAQTLAQTIHLSQHEYINAFGTDAWRQAVRDSVTQNADRPSSSAAPVPHLPLPTRERRSSDRRPQLHPPPIHPPRPPVVADLQVGHPRQALLNHQPRTNSPTTRRRPNPRPNVVANLQMGQPLRPNLNLRQTQRLVRTSTIRTRIHLNPKRHSRSPSSRCPLLLTIAHPNVTPIDATLTRNWGREVAVDQTSYTNRCTPRNTLAQL